MSAVPEPRITCPNCGAQIILGEPLLSHVRREVELAMHRELDERVRLAVEQAEARGRERARVEIEDLKAQLVEQRRLRVHAQERELELRKNNRMLEQRQEDFDLEMARCLEEEKGKLRGQIRKEIMAEYEAILREKDKQIEALHKTNQQKGPE